MADQLAGIIAAAVIQYQHVDIFYFHGHSVSENYQLEDGQYGNDDPAAGVFPDSFKFLDDQSK